jgi:hypothetical protein
MNKNQICWYWKTMMSALTTYISSHKSSLTQYGWMSGPSSVISEAMACREVKIKTAAIVSGV